MVEEGEKFPASLSPTQGAAKLRKCESAIAKVGGVAPVRQFDKLIAGSLLRQGQHPSTCSEQGH